MHGTGKTVFAGGRVEDFYVEILGVLENIGPKQSLILARLSGGPLEKTGVIAGMSGSPVYIDGKLIGAVSYALGSFPKEPIAGITPIAEMTDATAARLKLDVDEFRRLNAEANPVRRVGYPEDIAAAAAFLCSDEASYITGQTLSVSGGYTMI